ncbi:hypothetical protein EVAR_88958_1 [Eumeta japonica]|uniref:Uncharacterized protein n=1 Tax=Eumeta variegata TaxID=151549 RepID=A0A4C1VRA5_EUMVA|nr:hypothetical protein EVAR_88958_1 [Eumeta japonica]
MRYTIVALIEKDVGKQYRRRGRPPMGLEKWVQPNTNGLGRVRGAAGGAVEAALRRAAGPLPLSTPGPYPIQSVSSSIRPHHSILLSPSRPFHSSPSSE